MKLSACIEWLFAEAGPDFAARLRAAAAAGLPAVEFWRWRDKDLGAIAAAAADTGTVVAGFCVEPWGELTDPASHQTWLRGVRESCAAAAQLGVTNLITQVGPEQPGVDRATQHEAVVVGLQLAAPILEGAGVTVLIEPLNTLVDHPGYYLSDTAEGIQIVREVASPAVGLIYDRYHAMVMGEPIGYGVEGNLDIVKHVHIADAPGRHEPGTGGADWPAELAWFRAQGYGGYFGLEYQPTGPSAQSLAYFAGL
ncbi:MAG: TIM barrel protein [Bifidobacteriaceae bacterium]|nr:TIM barrel protein [Bifidobacteriaceae bacterium]